MHRSLRIAEARRRTGQLHRLQLCIRGFLVWAACGVIDDRKAAAQEFRAAARATRTEFDSVRSDTLVTRPIAERAVAENVGDMLAEAQGVTVLLDVAYKSYASGAYAPGRNLMLGLRGSL